MDQSQYSSSLSTVSSGLDVGGPAAGGSGRRFFIVFTRFVPIDTGDIPYAVFSYVAIVPWTFLAAGFTIGYDWFARGQYRYDHLIYFPREVLPTAAMLARLMDLGVATGLLIILMIIFKVPIFLAGWLFLPVILAIQISLILGLGLACAALNVFFRDVGSLVTLGLQLWFYASPIIYPVSMVPEALRPFYFLNPMAGIIEAYRDVIINGRMPGTYLIPSAATSVVIFALGYWFFKRVEFRFADIV